MDPKEQTPPSTTPSIVPPIPQAPPVPTSNQYYNSRGKKFGDFFLGLILLPLIGSVVTYAINILTPMLLSTQGITRPEAYISTTSSFSVIINILLFVLSLVYFLYKNRRYVILGLIFALLIPLLFFGACLFMINGISNQ